MVDLEEGTAPSLHLDRLPQQRGVEVGPEARLESARVPLDPLEVATDRAVAVALGAQPREVEAAVGDRRPSGSVMAGPACARTIAEPACS